ncbi:MAG: glycyl-radical enzyme activating protein [Bacteroidales bacterium]
MKGIVFDIKRFAIHDGPGIRTTVFLKGCPLRCWWCHNPESQELQSEEDVKQVMVDGVRFEKKESIGKQMTVEEVMQVIDKEAVFYTESGGGVTFSGGEPMVQHGFLLELLKACKTGGYHTAVDTCGHASPGHFKMIIPFTDLFLFDLKLINSEGHLKYTGQNNRLILENLDLLLQSERKVTIRIPVIPGINDGEEEINAFIGHLEKRKSIREIHLLPYHAMAKNKYTRFAKDNKLNGLKSMEREELEGMKKRYEEHGFSVKIGG